MTRDRRAVDANTAINLAIVRGIIGVSVILAAGAVGLAAQKLAAPEWIGNAVLSITSGLIGYLAREVKQAMAPPVVPPSAPREEDTP